MIRTVVLCHTYYEQILKFFVYTEVSEKFTGVAYYNFDKRLLIAYFLCNTFDQELLKSVRVCQL